MGGNTAFGSKTGDVLTWTTSVVFGVFLLLAIILNLIANHRQDEYNKAETVQSIPMSPSGQ
jgi:preprotein translocase subunit SecG